MFWIIALVAFLIAGVVLISYYIADRKNPRTPPMWFVASSIVVALCFVFCIVGIVELSVDFDQFDAKEEIKGSEAWADHTLWTGFNRYENRCTAEKIDEDNFEIISCEGD